MINAGSINWCCAVAGIATPFCTRPAPTALIAARKIWSGCELARELHQVYESPLKGGLEVVPNPTHAFARHLPVFLYYEIYGLTQDTFGQSRYTVEYRVSSKKKNPIVSVLRSLGKLAGVTTLGETETIISTEQSGYKVDQNAYIELDVSKLDPGRYEVAVSITDQVQKDVATKSVDFTIIGPDKAQK